MSEEELKTTYRLRYSERNLQLVESLLLKRQRFETDKNQLERRVKIALHEYIGQYQNAYFNTVIPLLKKANLVVAEDQKAIWVNVVNEIIVMKQKALNDLMGIIYNPSFSAQKLKLVTDELHVAVEQKWDDALNKLAQNPETLSQIKESVGTMIHKVVLQGWEKRRLTEIKDEQFRPFRERIVLDNIKANESFGVYLNRKLFEFAQWTSWSSLANLLDTRYHFTRPITDNEVDLLIFKSDESLPESSSSMTALSKTNKPKSSVKQKTTLKEPLHSDLFNQKGDENKQNIASADDTIEKRL